MRLMRLFGASFWLRIGLAGSAAVGLGVAAIATSGPAFAATASSPGSTVASVVPSRVTPGTRVTFAVACANPDSSSATLVGQTLGLPEQIPMGNGAASGDFVVTVTLPSNIVPGTYHPEIDCSDGTSTSVTLHVTQLPSGGGAETGDGTTSTTTTTNTGLAVGGLVLIGVGAVAGGIALRRRSGNRP
jgi:hypothetical protein